MECVLCLIGILILFRYFYILIRYIKTKEFKKKKFEGNILGMVAYTFLVIFIVNILILLILVSHDTVNIINMWIIFLSGLFTVILYPGYWIVYLKQKNRDKKLSYYKEVDTKLNNKYGSNDKYNLVNMFIFDIPYDAEINEHFNSLISILTNNQISFFHPKEYKSVIDVYSYLYLNDYFKKWNGNDSIYLTCLKVNSMLKKTGIKLNIKVEDIEKDDDSYIKLRRKDMVPTLYYDLNKINEYIKKHSKGYELVATQITDPDSNEILDVFMCIGKSDQLNKFFTAKDDKKGKGDSNE